MKRVMKKYDKIGDSAVRGCLCFRVCENKMGEKSMVNRGDEKGMSGERL